MSVASIEDLLNVKGATFRGCDFDTGAFAAFGKGFQCNDATIIGVGPGETVHIGPGSYQNIEIISNGGTVICAPDTSIHNLNISGGKLTLETGGNCKFTGLNGQSTQFIDFRCGENNSFDRCDFRNATISMCSQMGDGTRFSNCDFQGTHLNCSLAHAELSGCKISPETRVADADLANCKVTDLKMVENGRSHYVTNGTELGIGECQFNTSAQAQINMSLAGISGGVTVSEHNAQANLPKVQAEQQLGTNPNTPLHKGNTGIA